MGWTFRPAPTAPADHPVKIPPAVTVAISFLAAMRLVVLPVVTTGLAALVLTAALIATLTSLQRQTGAPAHEGLVFVNYGPAPIRLTYSDNAAPDGCVLVHDQGDTETGRTPDQVRDLFCLALASLRRFSLTDHVTDGPCNHRRLVLAGWADCPGLPGQGLRDLTPWNRYCADRVLWSSKCAHEKIKGKYRHGSRDAYPPDGGRIE